MPTITKEDIQRARKNRKPVQYIKPPSTNRITNLIIESKKLLLKLKDIWE